MVKTTFDFAANALYIRVSNAQVAGTRDLDANTFVDLDHAGNPVGVEVINPNRAWPVDALLATYPIASADADVLRVLCLSPTSGSMTSTVASMKTSTPAPALVA